MRFKITSNIPLRVVIFLIVWNGAKRWNDWNVWNAIQTVLILDITKHEHEQPFLIRPYRTHRTNRF
jgi:hypothetical protein